MTVKRPATLKDTVPRFWRILRYFRPYLRKHRMLIGASMAAVFCQTLLRLLEPWPLKLVFDRVIAPPASGGSGIDALDRLPPSTLLLVAACALVVITALRALAAYGSSVGFALIGNRVLTEVRADLYRHLQRLSLTFHAKARAGDLVVRIVNDVGLLKDATVTAVLPLLANVLILAGMLGFMLWLEWRLALLALVTLPFLSLSTIRLTRRIREVARKQREREGAIAAAASEAMMGIRAVQALSLEPVFDRAFAGQNSRSYREGVKASRLAAHLERSVDVLAAVSTALVLWQGARLVMGGSLTAGDLLVFLRYLHNGFRPIHDFAKYSGRLAKATAAGDRVVELLERPPEIHDRADAIVAPRFLGAVVFDHVSFGYDRGTPVLQDVSLQIEPGCRVAIVGPSGNGKSTLVSLLVRLFDPQHGRVLVDGRDIRDYTLESLRTQISIVLQDTILFAGTVRENIASGANRADDAAIVAAARLAHVEEFVSALPEGYDTVVGERGITLSTGQRQRIAVTRAAVRQAPILVFDEATLSLDRASEQAVVEGILRLSEGKTTFIVTHDPRLADHADVVVYVEGGQVREVSRHARAS